MAAQTLVIKATAGKDHPERCGQALTVAATAAASGVTVSLWLAAEAAWLALPGRADDIVLPHSPPMADLLASIVAGGRVTLCTQCAARRDISPGDVRLRGHRRRDAGPGLLTPGPWPGRPASQRGWPRAAARAAAASMPHRPP